MFLECENNIGKLQIISGKFQNNAINDIKQISQSHVLNEIECIESIHAFYFIHNVFAYNALLV